MDDGGLVVDEHVSGKSEALRDFWARCAQYERLGLDRRAAARFVARAAGSLCGPVLDVGTGRGLFAVELARRGVPVVSVDVDGEQQDFARLVAREAGVGDLVQFVEGDAARLEYPSEHFRCVAMMDVLHHLEQPAPILREMCRVLRAGHPLIVGEFDEAGFDLVASVHRDDGGTHARTATTFDGAVEELVRLGLRPQRRSAGYCHHVAVMLKTFTPARFRLPLASRDEPSTRPRFRPTDR